MKICPRCNTHMDDGKMYCPICGNPMESIHAENQWNQWESLYEYSERFDPKDISDNKIMAMLPYLMGTIGIIIALLASRQSAYTYFHVRQAVKMKVTQLLLAISSIVLCWTLIVPLAAIVCNIIIFVLQIIAFFQVCSGQAKEPAIIKDLPFLK